MILATLTAALTSAGCGNDQPATPTTRPPAISTTVATDASGATTVPTNNPPRESTAAPTTLAAPTPTSPPDTIPIEDLRLVATPVADGFEQAVFVTAPVGDDRLFVVDQSGIVWLVAGGDPQVFLDIRERVRFGGEQGLLGLAFPPDFEGTGLFYVNYTDNGGDTQVAEFRSDGLTADPASERTLLEVDQPASNHNGGMLAFGPDGLLWIGMGDGGSRDDRFGNGQNPASLLGTMLRIDPAGDPYDIPDDNPGGELAPEIWATGLRNPWRFGFDGNDLWIADVGQNSREEINRVDITADAGANFGWPLFEGASCYLSNCDDSGLTAPVFDYSHGEGCSVTGGYVYRGEAIPELDGHYFFGDFCGGWVRSLAPGETDPLAWLEPGAIAGLSSFGVDGRGELYVTSTQGGVFRLERAP